jgi:16S rRNA (guanine527-N7)-methyltransferase
MNLVKRFFPNLSEEIICQIENFCQLIKEKNEQINLISRKNIDQIEAMHILPSLAITKVANFRKNAKILDIGSGGGFPAIPLAIVYYDRNFTLIDSMGKKINAVAEICKNLGLENVECICDRVEKIDGEFEYITGRAVTNWEDFKQLAYPKLRKNGKIFYLSGGNLERDAGTKFHDICAMYDSEFCETKKIIEHIKQTIIHKKFLSHKKYFH